jgi:hypothetical protein
MSYPTAVLIALCVLALLVIAFFAVFRGKGKFRIKTKLGEASAEGENPHPPTAIAAGVKIKDAEAGGSLRAHNVGSGGVDLDKIRAKGDIDVSSSPGGPLPKA